MSRDDLVALRLPYLPPPSLSFFPLLVSILHSVSFQPPSFINILHIIISSILFMTRFSLHIFHIFIVTFYFALPQYYIYFCTLIFFFAVSSLFILSISSFQTILNSFFSPYFYFQFFYFYFYSFICFTLFPCFYSFRPLTSPLIPFSTSLLSCYRDTPSKTQPS